MNWKRWFKILGFLLFFALIYVFLRSDFWQVKKIICQFNQLDCSQEIANKVSELSFGKNLVFMSRQTLINKIKENLPQVDMVKIKKRIPDKLLFELTSRKPVVALAVEGVIYYLVDEQGVVAKKMEENQNLPLILFDKDPQFKVGEKINQEEILQTIKIIMGMKLRLLQPKVSRIISPREIEIWLENETLAILNGQKEIENQLDSLQFIYSRSKIEGKQVKKIDLRFDKPIIVE